MSTTIEGSAQELSRELQERLAAARREKSLAQVPALRRLRNSVRILLILSIPGLLVTLPAGSGVRGVWNAVNTQLSTSIAFVLFVALVWSSMSLSWLQFYAYVRFLRQFKRNHLEDLRETANLLPRIVAYGLTLGVAALPIGFFMFRRPEEVVVFAVQSLGGLVMALLMFFFIRHYVRTAKADLDGLLLATGADSPRGHYPPWGTVYIILLFLVLVVLAIGYFLAGFPAG